MILIALDKDQRSISVRFRKADSFAFVRTADVRIEDNGHKTSQSPLFFEYFQTLGVEKLYIKALGYKTFLTLDALGVEVYFVQGIEDYRQIEAHHLLRIDSDNAQAHCTLGHHRK